MAITFYTSIIVLLVTINLAEIPGVDILPVYLLFFPLTILLKLFKIGISGVKKTKYLFRLNRTEYEDYLQEGGIADELREAFPEEGHDLVDDAELYEDNDVWRIHENAETRYRIEVENDELNIYNSKNKSKEVETLLKDKRTLEGMSRYVDVILILVLYPTLISFTTLIILLENVSTLSIIHITIMCSFFVMVLLGKHFLKNTEKYVDKGMNRFTKYSINTDLFIMGFSLMGLIPLIHLITYEYNFAFEGYIHFALLSFLLIFGINYYLSEYLVLKIKYDLNTKSLGKLFELREKLVLSESNETDQSIFDEYFDLMGVHK